MSDPTSQANYTEICTEHVAFKWNIDFINKKIAGSATHDLRVSKDQVAEVMSVVDRYSRIFVLTDVSQFRHGRFGYWIHTGRRKISLCERCFKFSKSISHCERDVKQYEVKPKHPIMGSALHIPLPSGLKSGTLVKATITYQTTKDCTALQWLAKEWDLRNWSWFVIYRSIS